MNLKILYDNRAEEGFLSSWGFSCLVEADINVLFDVGWDPKVLEHNMEQFGISVENIDIIVLSHAHWDHIGALPAVLSDKKSVYVPRSFSPNLKREISERASLVEVSGSMKITERVSTTGELGHTIKEQSLLIESEQGSVILTGCAHPGLENILKVCSSQKFAVIGGFHGFAKYGILRNAFMICPCHCTQHTEELEKLFPATCRRGAAGYTVGLGD